MKKELVIAEYEHIWRKGTPNKRPGDVFESILTEAIFSAALKSYSKEEIIQLCSRGMPVFIDGEHVMEYMFRHHDDALEILTGLFMKTTDEDEKTGFRDLFLTRLFPEKFEYKNDEQLCERILSYYLVNKRKLIFNVKYSNKLTVIRWDKGMDDVPLFILK